MKCWNAESGQLITELDAGDSWVAKAVYNPLRNVLATAAGKHLKLWSDNRELSYESSDHSSTLADIGWNPDGSGLAVAVYGITLHVQANRINRASILGKVRASYWNGVPIRNT